MLILTPVTSVRFEYACSIVLRDYLGELRITTDSSEFNQHKGIKISYSSVPSDDKAALHIYRYGQLWAESIDASFVPEVAPWKTSAALFPANHALGFDVFSACFYLLTRYEEYMQFDGDVYHRFRAKDSLLHNSQLYREPLVDQWIQCFQEFILQQWPEAPFKKNNFQFISTIDVDSAFAYKHKGLKRTLGGFAKDVIGFNYLNLFKRTWTLSGILDDQYHTYSYINERHKVHGIKSIFFFLLADFGKLDKGVAHTSKGLQTLIREQQTHSEVGVHPGVASNDESSKLTIEKRRLEDITSKICTQSRQHYLMLTFPATYRNLLNAGITDDYSMGFHDDVGFRAGTCRPIKWFDLERNEVTDLTIHPFAVMDATLQRYLKLSPDNAIQLNRQIMNEVKKVNGTFISIWHNETLTDKEDWKGWRRVWEDMLSAADGAIR